MQNPKRLASQLVLALALALFVLPVVASAQQAPLLERPAPPPIPEREPEPDAPDAAGRILKRIPIPTDDPAADLFAGGAIEVRGFRFVGNESLSTASLDAIVRPYLGKGRRYGALLEARDRVTRAYIDAGFISSGAVLPDQAIDDGIVELQIVEGRLSTIEAKTDGRLREHYLTSRLALAAGDGALDINALRHRLRILKRDPNIASVSAELSPGAARDESLLVIDVVEAPAWQVGASADDYVPPAIGGYRGTFSGSYRNLSGWGEAWSLNYSVAEGLHDIGGRVAVPVTRWDTSLELRGRGAWSEIVESGFEQFDIESRTRAFELRVAQPLLRERSYTLASFVAVEWKRGLSFLLGDSGLDPFDGNDDGRSTSSALRVGFEGWWRGETRALSARLVASRGFDILGAGADDLGLSGNFWSGLWQLQAVEYLPWYGMRVHARFDAQVADRRLLGLEQFPVGGHASVRGYRENRLVRDRGLAGSLELRVPLPLLFGPIERFEFGLFSDAGYAKNRYSLIGGDELVSVGFGLHADVTRYVSASFEYAYAIENPQGPEGDHLQDDGVHFALHLRFP